MKYRIIFSFFIAIAITLGLSGCATKKYARNRINERVTPLENRAGELEETSRRNSQDISSLGQGIADARSQIDRVSTQAETALSRAGEANTKAGSLDDAVRELRSNLDKYQVQTTTTVNFRFDSYELTPEAVQTLDDLAAQIKSSNNFLLEIEGFADATGTDAYNEQLTQRRADAVRRYLAERHSVPLYRMHLLGFGERRPVADNTSQVGRAQNRRVTIRLLSRNISNGVRARTNGQ